MANQWTSDPKDVELEAVIAREVRGLCPNIRVSVRGGHATLSGTVEDFGDKRDVSNAVRDVAGVREVTNNIRVASSN